MSLNREKIESFYRDTLHISDDIILYKLIQGSSLRKVKKRTVIYQQGYDSDLIYILRSGIYYGIYPKTDTRNVIDRIGSTPGTFISSIHKSIYFEPEGLQIVCATPCEFIVFPRTLYDEVFPKSKELQDYVQNNIAMALNRHIEKGYMRSLSPTNRVKYFFENYPVLSNSLTQSEIAEFLDMSRQELSKHLRVQNL